MAEGGVYDVVVAGSGAGGLVAALQARERGASVVVLEKSDKLGGGSAFAPGLFWLPLNRYSADTRQEADAYLQGLSMRRSPDALRAAFLESAADVVAFLESKGTAFALLSHPDYHSELEGARSDRTLTVENVDARSLGRWKGRVRNLPPYHPPVALTEIEQWGGLANVRKWPLLRLAVRSAARVRAGGAALVASLVRACLDCGVELRTEAPLRRIVMSDDGVRGVEIVGQDEVESIETRRLILATGGFEWDEQMCGAFLRGPHELAFTPPVNTGDGHKAGMEVGAGLDLMTEAVWGVGVKTPQQLEGKPLSRFVIAERVLPGSIMVNSAGHRFCNESASYHDVVAELHRYDAGTLEYPNIPAFVVFDAAFRKRYPVFGRMPRMPLPRWVVRAKSIEALAEALGVAGKELAGTLDRFNWFARQGQDEDFGRGETIYDRHWGDPAGRPNPCLAPVEEPPFYAATVLPGSFGTKGGLRIDDSARVLSVRGEPIDGLYACGNVSAAQSIVGAGYQGGVTIACSMAFGNRAGAV